MSPTKSQNFRNFLSATWYWFWGLFFLQYTSASYESVGGSHAI